MPQKIKQSLALIALVTWLSLCGCADKNSQTGYSADGSGGHPSDWVQKHWLVYNALGKGVTSAVDVANSTCAQCHGVDLTGGISKVSCFSLVVGAQNCHAGGPTAGHDVAWKLPTQHGHGAITAPNASAVSAGFAYCAKCHGSNFDNGDAKSCKSCHTKAPHPDAPWHGTTASGTNHVFTDPANADQCAKCHLGGNNSVDLKTVAVPAAGAIPGCFNSTLCHDSKIHDALWSYSPASKNFHNQIAKISTNNCTSCHGPYLNGGTAPSCSTNTNSSSTLQCHANATPNGAKATDCTSCHGNPPDGSASSAWPNRQLSHGDHLNVPGVKCSACHQGGGTGTTNHAIQNSKTAYVAFSSAFGKGATVVPGYPVDPAFTPLTCANVSCHGGLTTPPWGSPAWGSTDWVSLPSGSNSKLACVSCHQAASAAKVHVYNSYSSGSLLGVNLHDFHLRTIKQPLTSPTRLIKCEDCHDTTKLIPNATDPTNNAFNNHFSGITANKFGGVPAITVGNTFDDNGNAVLGIYKYDSDRTKRTCNSVSCHITVNFPVQNNVQWFDN